PPGSGRAGDVVDDRVGDRIEAPRELDRVARPPADRQDGAVPRGVDERRYDPVGYIGSIDRATVPAGDEGVGLDRDVPIRLCRRTSDAHSDACGVGRVTCEAAG